MEGEFEFFDEDDIANAESEQHDVRRVRVGGVCFGGSAAGEGALSGILRTTRIFSDTLEAAVFRSAFFVHRLLG